MKLHRQEKFIYICDTLHMWEWDVRVLDIQDGVEDDQAPVCLGGRGAALCGGPTGYRLMLKRQRDGDGMSDPVRMEAGIQMLTEACPDQPTRTWDLLRTVVDEGFQSIDRRLKESGPLQPDRFNLKEANERGLAVGLAVGGTARVRDLRAIGAVEADSGLRAAGDLSDPGLNLARAGGKGSRSSLGNCFTSRATFRAVWNKLALSV